MPGILPMKVIKVGTSAQTRIAQACDRCRSKKIRCDGIRPCCSQCSNVGFECKTSDKLSRRAFPRGYTESLEERVRSLESEVRELKDLLDEKDEKIDMLSRIHSQSSQTLHLPSPRRTSTLSSCSKGNDSSSPEKDEVFTVQQSPYLLDADGSDSYFAGTSNSRTLLEAFKSKAQESTRSIDSIDIELLLDSGTSGTQEASLLHPEAVAFKPPPRLISDQLINIFFQEWAPLFPIIHRPSFLALYEKYVWDNESVTERVELAQLNLVFAIAATSSGSRTTAQLNDFGNQWKTALDAVLTEGSMATLQVLVLAQIACAQQGDFARLLTYKGLSTSLSARLGLHQSQRRFALDALACETRKKVFWSLYTVDCFTAVSFGLPKHIRDEDIECEYPVDVDDEYITEHGFQPTLPGESTKLSSALALFRITRILSRVLEEVFPAKVSYELSLKKLSDLQDELDTWSSSLAPHLRLEFVQDKPSRGTISSRSPLLSLVFHYIRALIDRPAICAAVGNQHSRSMMSHAVSCKHIVQIMQLLDERDMSFVFCGKKDELLVVAGFGLLIQSLYLDADSKILKDNQKMVKTVSRLLTRDEAPCAQEFVHVMRQFNVDPTDSHELCNASKPTSPALSINNVETSMSINPLPSLPASTRRQLKAIASRFSTGNNRTTHLNKHDDKRRASFPVNSLHTGALPVKHSSLPNAQLKFALPSASRSAPAREFLGTSPNIPAKLSRPQTHAASKFKSLNLDYLSFGSDSEGYAAPQSNKPIKPEPQPTDWERLLASLDNGDTNIYDACYGGQPVEALIDTPPNLITDSTPILTVAVESTSWDAPASLWSNLCHTESNSTMDTLFSNTSTGADSILSFSSDDLSAGRSGSEDLDWGCSATDKGSVGPRGPSASVGHELEGVDAASWDAVLPL